MDDDPTSADAEWKKIQQNTFTRWVNEHLKVVQIYVYNLETDLEDGVKLIALLEILSQKRISRYNKAPKFPPQKLENISIALKFVEDQCIKLVNIGASDISNGNLKLILGLIWTLILKYSICTPILDEADDGENLTPKDGLLRWIKSKVPDTPINNFTKDWNNGLAIGALVDAFAPGLCPDWQDWKPEDALKNVKGAMKLAEDWLGVPQVLAPEDMTNPNLDALSTMTYLSGFLRAELKPGAPLRL